MADKETSALTSASALDGTEIVHVVQSSNSRKATTSQFPAIPNTGLTNDTGPNPTDTVSGYATTDAAAVRFSLLNLFRVLHQFTSDTGPNTTDEMAVYEAAGDTVLRISLANLLKVVDQLTEDASPDSAADFLLSFDVSAGAAKKVKPNALSMAPVAASQAEQESGAITNKAVTPGRQQFHPSAAKCWAFITVSGGVPTLAASYNITSITDVGAGDVTITIATDFSSANWAPQCSVDTASANTMTLHYQAVAAGSITLQMYDGATTLTDPASWSFVGYGDQ